MYGLSASVYVIFFVVLLAVVGVLATDGIGGRSKLSDGYCYVELFGDATGSDYLNERVKDGDSFGSGLPSQIAGKVCTPLLDGFLFAVDSSVFPDRVILYTHAAFESGPAGERGSVGPQGPQGPKGEKGDKGDPGDGSFDGVSTSVLTYMPDPSVRFVAADDEDQSNHAYRFGRLVDTGWDIPETGLFEITFEANHGRPLRESASEVVSARHLRHLSARTDGALLSITDRTHIENVLFLGPIYDGDSPGYFRDSHVFFLRTADWDLLYTVFDPHVAPGKISIFEVD